MSANKMVTIATEELGYLEKKSNSQLDDKTANAGSNNYTKYGAWYSNGALQGQAWCDMFVSWVADQAGEASAVGCYAYCPYHVSFFKNKSRWHARSGYTPVVGDIIFFTTNGTTACHVGLVTGVTSSKVTTIEGNTSGASTLVANGGGVCQKAYSLTSTYILGYGNPAYSGTGTSTTTTTTSTTTTTTTTTSSTTKVTKTTAVAKSYDKSLSKSYTVKANGGLNMRNGAGTGKAVMVTIPSGTKVRCYGYYTAVSGVKWLCVVATVSGVQYTGFVHSGYLV